MSAFLCFSAIVAEHLMRGCPPRRLHFEQGYIIAVLSSVGRWVANGDTAKLVDSSSCATGIVDVSGVTFIGYQLRHECLVLAVECQIATKECTGIASKIKINGRYKVVTI